MGKGDQKTRKGKIVRGTYGVTRPRRKNTELANKEKSPATANKKSKA